MRCLVGGLAESALSNQQLFSVELFLVWGLVSRTEERCWGAGGGARGVEATLLAAPWRAGQREGGGPVGQASPCGAARGKRSPLGRQSLPQL